MGMYNQGMIQEDTKAAAMQRLLMTIEQMKPDVTESDFNDLIQKALKGTSVDQSQIDALYQKFTNLKEQKQAEMQMKEDKGELGRTYANMVRASLPQRTFYEQDVDVYFGKYNTTLHFESAAQQYTQDRHLDIESMYSFITEYRKLIVNIDSFISSEFNKMTRSGVIESIYTTGQYAASLDHSEIPVIYSNLTPPSIQGTSDIESVNVLVRQQQALYKEESEVQMTLYTKLYFAFLHFTERGIEYTRGHKPA